MIDPQMTFRVYLRFPDQTVQHKTVTGSQDVALAAFEELIKRNDLDGQKLLAVLNFDGQRVAHHDFRQREDGKPFNPANYWRGRTSDIKWAAV